MKEITKEKYKEWTSMITGKCTSETDLNGEIAKYAEEHELNSDQIDRLCNFVNVHMFNLMMNDNKVAENKYIQFKTAQSDEVKALLNKNSEIKNGIPKQAHIINMSELWKQISFDVFTEEMSEKTAEIPRELSVKKIVCTDKLNNLKSKLRKTASIKKADWEYACKIGNTVNIGHVFERLAKEMELPYTTQKLGSLYYTIPGLVELVKDIIVEERNGRY